MKRNLQLLFVAGLMLLSGNIFAQRYLKEVFTAVDTTANVVYGQNYSFLPNPASPTLIPLKMDVYQPNGDVETKRPLIILMHAGSFLPPSLTGLPFGEKSDSAMAELCRQFAKRGWVAVSMSYRLGWAASSSDQEVKASTIINAVYRAMQDAKACVRFFKKDAKTTNMYKVDTTKIVVGGDNSGGYAALCYAALNKVPELSSSAKLVYAPGSPNGTPGTPFINQAVLGDFEGRVGNPAHSFYNHPGHTSDIQMVLNLGGATGDTLWFETGEVPIVAFHGYADPLTPYGTKVVTTASGASIIEVSGSGHFMRYGQKIGNQLTMQVAAATFTDPYTVQAKKYTNIEGLYPFYGAANGFEPWAWYKTGHAVNPMQSKARALTYIDTIMGYFSPRAVAILGLPTVGINENSVANTVKVYPNPSATVVNVVTSATNLIESIQVFDVAGKLVKEEKNLDVTKYTFDHAGISNGMYFLNVQTKQGLIVEKLIFE